MANKIKGSFLDAAGNQYNELYVVCVPQFNNLRTANRIDCQLYYYRNDFGDVLGEANIPNPIGLDNEFQFVLTEAEANYQVLTAALIFSKVTDRLAEIHGSENVTETH